MKQKIFLLCSLIILFIPFVFYGITFFYQSEIIILLMFIFLGIGVIYLVTLVVVILAKKREEKLLDNLIRYGKKHPQKK